MKKIFLLIIILCSSQVLGNRPSASAFTATACDRRYALQVEQVMKQLRGQLPQDRLNLALQYMIILKHHQDLDFRIYRFETGIFKNLELRAALRLPLFKYQRCFDRSNLTTARLTSELTTTVRPVSVVACDRQYANDMKKALQQLSAKISPDRMPRAEEYMIMLKQYQDLDFKIRLIERLTFSMPISALIRSPLQYYQRCRSTLISEGDQMR